MLERMYSTMGSLARRTEQAAANLEQSAASMEQIGSTVRQTSDHTAEAAKVAGHNAEVATGGWPVKPSVPGAELGFTSNEAFHLHTLPKRIVIVGRGYVAVEFASMTSIWWFSV